ncbi:putative L-ascorbate peroxidase 8 [Hibiscus syriacus]|uniref:L-ascorbate peroxidase 8 n=1 Tax=Hibiscus syriacus TaxID=106335 RepID=A0A6A2ZV83_HIBSY|nr:putative L-ascorbate peroxidase 8 [Hibiscus syriacus]
MKLREIPNCYSKFCFSISSECKFVVFLNTIYCQVILFMLSSILNDGPGEPGGQSWTVQWLKFDNSYFKDIKAKTDEDLLVLPSDSVLFEDPSFKVYAEKYAEDQEAFFKDYAEAHAKLSNFGAKFDPPEGIVLDDTPIQAAPEKFVAAKYSTGKGELSDAMKQKIRAEYESFGRSPDKPLPTNYFLNIIIIIGVLAILTSLLGNY